MRPPEQIPLGQQGRSTVEIGLGLQSDKRAGDYARLAVSARASYSESANSRW